MLPSTWLTLGVIAAEMDDLEAANHHYDEGILTAQASQAKSAIIELLWYRGDARMRQGDLESAYTDLQEALSLARENRILYFLCEITTALSRWHLKQNQVEAARAPLLEALGFALELGSDNFLVLPLVSAMMLWRLKGQAEQATRWAGLLSNYPQYVHPRLFTPLCAQLALDLGGDDYRQAFERGKSLHLKETVNDVIGLLNLPENG